MHRIWCVAAATILACKDDPKPPMTGEASGSAAKPLPTAIEQDVAKAVAVDQATAKKHAGSVAIKRAWRPEKGPSVAAKRAWVQVDVDFGALALDTDDLELVDADRGGASAIGDARRLDGSGNLVAMSGAHSQENHYLLGFSTEAATKRVSLRYAGVTLSAAPIEIAASGPEFAEEKREVVRHFAKGDRHVLVFEDQNLEDPPSSITNHLEFDGGECEMRGLLHVSASLAVLEPEPEAFAPHALYAADFTCAKPPTRLRWGVADPIPVAEPWTVPAATMAALEGRGPGIAIVAVATVFPVVAIRRDGSMIAIAAGKDGIQLVDAAGTPLGTLPSTAFKFERLGFTPDGTHLWGVEEYGDVMVWDVAKRARVASRRLAPEPGMYTRPALSSDGRWLVVDSPWTKPDATSVAWSGQLSVLAMPDLSVKANVKIVDGDEGSLVDLQLSPDGKRVVVCATTGKESLVRVYGLPRGEQQVAIRSTTSRPRTCALAPDGRVLVGTEAGELETYSRAGKKLSTVMANAGGVQTIAVRPDGTFVTGGADGRVIDWASGKPLVLFKHRYPVGDVVIAGDQVASSAPYDATVVVGGKVAARFDGGPLGAGEIVAVPGVAAVGETMIPGTSSRVRIRRSPTK